MRDKPTDLTGPVPWVRIEDFDGMYLRGSKSGQGVTLDTVRDMNLKVYPAGTVLCSCSCSMGATAIATVPLVSNQTFIGITPHDSLDSRYLYYLLSSAAREPQAHPTGAIQQYLSRNDFATLRIPLPARITQTEIANYLDSETTRVDALIDRKRRFNDLLLEKRTAVITHAVTKGLDSQAATRDSGVDWIGVAPSAWRVMPIKRVASLLTGVTPPTSEPKYYEDGDVPWYGPSAVGDGFEVSAPVKMLNRRAIDDRVARTFPPGATLLTAIGASIGSSGFSPRSGTTNQQMVALTARASDVWPMYLAWALKAMKPAIRAAASSATLPILNQTQVGAFPLPIPSLAEQRAIADHLAAQIRHIDSVVGHTTRSIDLLREYRTALISAAVTGQIEIPGTETSEDVA